MLFGKIAVLSGVGLLLLGCTGQQPEQSREATNSAGQNGIDEVLATYDVVRSRLADDDTAELSGAFERLRTATLSAMAEKDMPEPIAERLDRMSKAAATGAKLEGGDLEGQRRAFAEVSEHLLGAIASQPGLEHGLSIFECPMTNGYPKWVQLSDAKANPYMGKEMKSCGVESQWE